MEWMVGMFKCEAPEPVNDFELEPPPQAAGITMLPALEEGADDNLDPEPDPDVSSYVSEAVDPYNDFCCPAMPFPVWPLRYPGRAQELFERTGRVHGAPCGQPSFPRAPFRKAAFRFMKPGKSLPRGFFFEDDVFLRYDDEGMVARMKLRAIVILSLIDYRLRGIFTQLVRLLTCGNCFRETVREPSFSAYGDFNAQVNYARFLSRHSYTIDLFKAISVVSIKSTDAMTVLQLAIGAWLSSDFSELRDSDAWVLNLLIAMLTLSIFLWFFFAYRQTRITVARDIDYVGDLVWQNNNQGGRPVDDRVASDCSVRAGIFFTHLFELPYSVREVVNLCHPRKGAMRFGAFGGWGKLPRTIVLGYQNKVMFEYEEIVGFVSTLPHILFAKLPTFLLKLYIFVFYKRNFILGMSIAQTLIILLLKFATLVEYLFKSSTYRRWMVENYEEGTADQRLVLEKKLCTEFNYALSPEGKLIKPGLWSWLSQMMPSTERSKHEDGFLFRWRMRGSSNRICSSSGEEQIPPTVVEQLRLADETGCVRTEFWYRKEGRDGEGLLRYTKPDSRDASAWKYARLITVSSFTSELAYALARAALNMMYTIGVLNLCVFLMTKENKERIVSYALLIVFLLTRIVWIFVGIVQCQQALAIDWKEVGDFVTEVSFISRMELFVSNTVIHLFLLPKQVREAVALFHPEKNYQPFCAFGGRNFGPRAFALGFATKDMFLTESYHGVLAQTPLLIADCLITLGLLWELSLEVTIGLDSQQDMAKSLYERLNILVLIITSMIHCVMRLSSMQVYMKARQRYKKWLESRLGNLSGEAEIHALRKQWMTHFAYMPTSIDE